MSNHLHLELTENASDSAVFLNGEDISHWLTGLEVSADVDDWTRAILHLSPIRVTGNVQAQIPGLDGIERLRARRTS